MISLAFTIIYGFRSLVEVVIKFTQRYGSDARVKQPIARNKAPKNEKHQYKSRGLPSGKPT